MLAAHCDASVATLSVEEARSLPATLEALAEQRAPLGEHASKHALDVHRRFHAAIWDAATTSRSPRRSTCCGTAPTATGARA